MKNSFKNFLVGDFNILEEGSKNKSFSYIKFNSGFPQITYIFYQYNSFNPYSCFDFIGLYDSKEDKFYVTDKYKERYIDEGFNTDVNILYLDEVIEEIKLKIKQRILEVIKYNESNLSYNPSDINHIKSRVREEAYTLYMTDKEVDTTAYANVLSIGPIEKNHQFIIEYLLDKDAAILKKTEEYISKNTGDIAYSIKVLKETEEELQKLKNSGLYKERKKIINSITENMKTVNIDIIKDGKPFSCKIENKISYYTLYISVYYITSVDKRNEFRKLFGRAADISYEDIVRVKYGKKIVYERE